LIALQANPPTDSFKKREHYIANVIEIMQRDKKEKKVVKSINMKDEQDIAKSPEKGKGYSPSNISKLQECIGVFFSSQSMDDREQLWAKREEMQRKVLSII